jgi:hypothetical protein
MELSLSTLLLFLYLMCRLLLTLLSELLCNWFRIELLLLGWLF